MRPRINLWLIYLLVAEHCSFCSFGILSEFFKSVLNLFFFSLLGFVTSKFIVWKEKAFLVSFASAFLDVPANDILYFLCKNGTGLLFYIYIISLSSSSF